jgi:hypothetical protein
MIAARLSPSGLPNRYGAIPFAFPAAVELDGLGALSNALVCRRRHDKYAVVSEKKLLLTGAKAEVDSYLEGWRRLAVNRVCEAFELVKEAEMEMFGEKSYFYRKMNGLSPAPILTTTLTLSAMMFMVMASRNRRRKRISAPGRKG